MVQQRDEQRHLVCESVGGWIDDILPLCHGKGRGGGVDMLMGYSDFYSSAMKAIFCKVDLDPISFCYF